MRPHVHAVMTSLGALVIWPCAFLGSLFIARIQTDVRSIFASIATAAIAATAAQVILMSIARRIPARCEKPGCGGRSRRVSSRPIRYRCDRCGAYVDLGHASPEEAAESETHDEAAERDVALRVDGGQLSAPAATDGTLTEPAAGKLSEIKERR